MRLQMQPQNEHRPGPGNARVPGAQTNHHCVSAGAALARVGCTAAPRCGTDPMDPSRLIAPRAFIFAAVNFGLFEGPCVMPLASSPAPGRQPPTYGYEMGAVLGRHTCVLAVPYGSRLLLLSTSTVCPPPRPGEIPWLWRSSAWRACRTTCGPPSFRVRVGVLAGAVRVQGGEAAPRGQRWGRGCSRP